MRKGEGRVMAIRLQVLELKAKMHNAGVSEQLRLVTRLHVRFTGPYVAHDACTKSAAHETTQTHGRTLNRSLKHMGVLLSGSSREAA